MREIKFRAWFPKEKVMIEDYAESRLVNKGLSVVQFHSSSELYLTKKIILLQFTGLMDKKRTPIYEMDVVYVTNKGVYNGYKVVMWDKILLCYVLVDFKEYKKWTSSSCGMTYLKVSSGIKCDIMGNVFQGVALLK